ncbi:hypothetical protein B0H10DRAFT_2189760 [Mycena sp. CBHHK59/15]|nr:hypothetical protein B0H10DRAFT_2189760 [Mycena sp. CBHHK59/15]
MLTSPGEEAIRLGASYYQDVDPTATPLLQAENVRGHPPARGWGLPADVPQRRAHQPTFLFRAESTPHLDIHSFARVLAADTLTECEPKPSDNARTSIASSSFPTFTSTAEKPGLYARHAPEESVDVDIRDPRSVALAALVPLRVTLQGLLALLLDLGLLGLASSAASQSRPMKEARTGDWQSSAPPVRDGDRMDVDVSDVLLSKTSAPSYLELVLGAAAGIKNSLYRSSPVATEKAFEPNGKDLEPSIAVRHELDAELGLTHPFEPVEKTAVFELQKSENARGRTRPSRPSTRQKRERVGALALRGGRSILFLFLRVPEDVPSS